MDIILIIIIIIIIIKELFFFVPKYNPLPFCTTFIPSPVVANLIKSGVAARAALGFLDAAALPILLAISNALTGLLATFFPWKLKSIILLLLLNPSLRLGPRLRLGLKLEAWL